MDGAWRAPETGDAGTDNVGIDDGTTNARTGRSGEPARGMPDRVSVRVTRTPKRRARRWAFVTKNRAKDLAAPLDMPGAELAEIPVIGPIVLGLMALLLVVVLGIFLGGLLLAFIEVVLIGVLALIGWAWAWVRGHPKVVLLETDGQRWVKPDGPDVDTLADARLVRRGTDPTALDYQALY